MNAGRRIYIHAYSFRCLCLGSAAARLVILEALVGVRIRKMMYRRLVEDGVGMGLVSARQGERIRELIDGLELPSVTQMLRQTAFVVPSEGRHGFHSPVLTVAEIVEASCFDDNYFTFATGTAAAARMYADREPIKCLRDLMRTDPEDERVSDLTLIKGDVLSWLPLSPHLAGAVGADDAAMVTASNLAVAKGLACVEGAFRAVRAELGDGQFVDIIERHILDNLSEAIDAIRSA